VGARCDICEGQICLFEIVLQRGLDGAKLTSSIPGNGLFVLKPECSHIRIYISDEGDAWPLWNVRTNLQEVQEYEVYGILF
jgi:hypothetical protein